MTETLPLAFSERPVVTLELPLPANTRLLNPEQVLLKIGTNVHDVGSFCYVLRSTKRRRPGKPREVVIGSFQKQRASQIRQMIKVFSSLRTEGGKRGATVVNLLDHFKLFMDWADANGYPDCLAGGDATRNAFQLYAQDVEDRYRRHKFESANAFLSQTSVLTVLEAFTGLPDLGKGIRFIRTTSGSRVGTEPVLAHDYKDALAINSCMFNGLCDLVLDHRPFPFKLSMPNSFKWRDDYLWVFPTSMWFSPPYQWGDERLLLKKPNWVYDYEMGSLATFDEIEKRYKGKDSKRFWRSRFAIERASKSLEVANADRRNHFRRMLAMGAHNAFYFLFLAYTSANAAVVKDLETDGTMEETTANPGYRGIKWRAGVKKVDVIVPVAFVQALRRYMELRKYLLDGKEFPYLFMSLGGGKREMLNQVGDQNLRTQYGILRRINPQLPRMGVHKIRATALSHYRREYDASISAAVGQHNVETANKSYDAGTEADHYVEVSLVLGKIAQKAKEQKIVSKASMLVEAKPLEAGGVCTSYGQPEPLGHDVPLTPDCKSGCIFCSKRVLIAGEDDARKLASAVFLLEQLINGPLAEAEFRPQIVKFEEDLAKIRAFEGCAEMVERVKKDVYDYGNLTNYFADKFQLFLAVGYL